MFVSKAMFLPNTVINTPSAEEEKAELEQKHEQAMAKQLINDASTKMRAAIEQKNMQSVQVAQVMLKSGNEIYQEISKQL